MRPARRHTFQGSGENDGVRGPRRRFHATPDTTAVRVHLAARCRTCAKARTSRAHENRRHVRSTRRAQKPRKQRRCSTSQCPRRSGSQTWGGGAEQFHRMRGPHAHSAPSLDKTELAKAPSTPPFPPTGSTKPVPGKDGAHVRAPLRLRLPRRRAQLNRAKKKHSHHITITSHHAASKHLLGGPSLPRVRVEQPDHEVRENPPRLLLLSDLWAVAASAAPAPSPGSRQGVGLHNVRDVAMLEILLELGYRRTRVSRVLLRRL